MMKLFKYSTSLILGLLLLIVVSLVIVQFNKNKEELAQLDSTTINKLELMRESLIGKEFSDINTIIPEEKYVPASSKLIGYYHSYDCGGCVNKLKNVVIQVDSIKSDIAIFLVSNNLDNVYPVTGHDIELPYFVDKQGAFQKWTNFSYTPLLLYLDENEIIREVYYPTTPSYQKSRSRFFEYLKTAQS